MTGLNVVGMPFGMHGLGQEMRDKVRCMISAGIDVCVIEENYSSLTSSVSDPLMASLKCDEPKYRVNLFCQNLPAVHLLQRKRPALFEGRYNIVAPYWEFPEIPRRLESTIQDMDEVWVSNSFLKGTFEKYTSRPVIQMPLHLPIPQTSESEASSPKTLTFGYVFDCNSMILRKDPIALILAFLRAFQNDQSADVKLILKLKYEPSPNIDQREVDLIYDLAALDHRIELIDKPLTGEEMSALFDRMDVYVSPHRAEGLGRGILEAMLLGKYVIATNYSGPKEFLDPSWSGPIEYLMTGVGRAAIGDVKANFPWAVAKMDALTNAIRTAGSDVEGTREKGRQAANALRERMRNQQHGQACLERLEIVESDLASKTNEKTLPKMV